MDRNAVAESARGRCRLLWQMAGLFVLSALAVWGVHRMQGGGLAQRAQQLVASEAMQRAMYAVAQERAMRGPAIDPVHDPNLTGMIGGLFTPTTSTTGNLAAKRTSTNPDMAALVVDLLHEAGVRSGELVAVGGSGSFPALLVATLCAARALDLQMVLIVSLASSQWGANLDGFTWLDIERALLTAGVLPPEYAAIAVSVGGADDRGSDLPADGRAALQRRIEAAGVRLIDQGVLSDNVAERMALYDRDAPGSRIAAFVNIGGSWANLGTSAEVLDMRPGVPKIGRLPAPERQGVIHAMAARGVPVVHLLDLAALASMRGLPWDPIPLPTPGTWHPVVARPSPWVAAVSAVYLVGVGVWLLAVRRRGARGT